MVVATRRRGPTEGRVLGPDLPTPPEDEIQAFRAAIARKDAAEVTLVLERSALKARLIECAAGFHVAVDAGCTEEIISILAAHGGQLLEKRNLKGNTPLQVAVGKSMVETALALLAVGASARSKTVQGKNSVDIALHTLGRRAARLMPALHARVEAEVAAMQDSDPEREGDLACSVCGDRIRRQKQIDFLLQGTGAPRKHRQNTYIQIGLRDFGGALQRPINHRVADLKKLPKELAESVAVVEYCRRMLRSWDMDARRVVWVDCCSGVGLTSLLLSLAFPESRVIALDKISSFAVANHTEPGGSVRSDAWFDDRGQVEYMECDLFSDAAVAKINDEITAVAGGDGDSGACGPECQLAQVWQWGCSSVCTFAACSPYVLSHSSSKPPVCEDSSSALAASPKGPSQRVVELTQLPQQGPSSGPKSRALERGQLQVTCSQNSARGMRGNSVHMLPDDDLGEVTPRCHMIIASKGPECGVQRGPAVLSRGQQIVEPKPAEVRSPLSQGRVGEDGE